MLTKDVSKWGYFNFRDFKLSSRHFIKFPILKPGWSISLLPPQMAKESTWLLDINFVMFVKTPVKLALGLTSPRTSRDGLYCLMRDANPLPCESEMSNPEIFLAGVGGEAVSLLLHLRDLHQH